MRCEHEWVYERPADDRRHLWRCAGCGLSLISVAQPATPPQRTVTVGFGQRWVRNAKGRMVKADADWNPIE